ncbi:MAG: ribose 5-phosphate isomerase B [Bacilli bacterium]|nr:ribose 5-phosphate isomerase B [Bacilli bacterium]
MKIVVGSDHGGFEYKAQISQYLESKGYEVVDVGTYSKDSCNYAEYGLEAAELIKRGEADYGILICNTGEGIAMAANKVKGIRAGIGYDDKVVEFTRLHNNANIITFGANFMKLEDVLRRIDIFLNTEFEGGSHEKRVQTIIDAENR